jgi:hypothetical protein
MQQRRLRLGDILDDYCPRERRITNHAVVAMIEDTVKQTRCTTCDAEHEYKEAKVPAARRRKTGPLEAHLVEGSNRPGDAADVESSLRSKRATKRPRRRYSTPTSPPLSPPLSCIISDRGRSAGSRWC